MVAVIVAENHRGLVGLILREMGIRRNNPHYEDLFQEGFIGLMEAIPRYKEDMGATFSSYAKYWIRAYILLYLRKNRKYNTVGKYSSDIQNYILPTQEETLIRLERIGLVSSAIDSLVFNESDRNIQLITDRLMADKPIPLIDIANQWGVSKQRVNEIEQSLIIKVRNHLGRYDIC